jgi:uncharacterized protein (TIGR02117 family)
MDIENLCKPPTRPGTFLLTILKLILLKIIRSLIVLSLYRMKVFAFAGLLLLLTACSAPIMEINSYAAGENGKRVFVVHNNWHAALVIRKADLTHGIVPESNQFPEAEYLEMSWGDRDYFPATEEGVGLALRAAFWSRGSVLHVVGFKGGVRDYFTDGEIIEIAVSREAFQRLTEFVSRSFSRENPAVPAQSQPGLVSDSRFYPAVGKFSILRTCNTWIAEALKSAGLNIRPGYVITAASLARQLRRYRVDN